MEKEKALSSVESIEIIKSMIAESREGYESNGGYQFLLWGYISLIISVPIYIADINGHYWAHWFWFMIPIIGFPTTLFLIARETKRVTTFVDKFTSATWIIVGSVAVLLPIALSFSAEESLRGMSIPFEALILGMGTAISGLVIKFKPLIFGGITAIIISMIMLIVMDHFIILFMALFIISMIIPGHLIMYQKKRNKKQKQ